MQAPAAASGGFALVANTTATANASSPGSSPAINTTGSKLIILGVGRYLGNTVSDNQSNTWTLAGSSSANSGGGVAEVFYCYNPVVNASHVFTISGSNSYAVMFVEAFSGSAAAPLDQQNSAVANSTSTIQLGAITPTLGNELVVTVATNTGTATTSITVNQGFLQPSSFINGVGGTFFGGMMAYLIQGGAATVNPTWTSNESDNHSAFIASFKSG